MYRTGSLLLGAMLVLVVAHAQEKSVKPGINDSFKNPDLAKYAKSFEGESREVFAQREKIVAATGIKSGMIVADIGAGTGLFTRLFAKSVGNDGQVYAVDIAPKFLEHVQKTSRDAGLRNVTPVLCNFDSVDLAPNSIDLAFVCDTYHHFEFPQRTLASLHRALKPEGKLVVIDFVRIPGQSSEWTLNHVRAGQDVVEKEIAEAGFKKAEEVKEIVKENYFVIFTKSGKANAPRKTAPDEKKPVAPVIPNHGAVVPLPDAVEQPLKGSKVVFDVTSVGKDTTSPATGLVRAATLLNLAQTAGVKPNDLQIAIVLHGESAKHSLSAKAYQVRFGAEHPSAALIASLHQAGVRIMVCGQSLQRQGLPMNDLHADVTTAASAVTAVINLQRQGYAYIPAQNP